METSDISLEEDHEPNSPQSLQGASSAATTTTTTTTTFISNSPSSLPSSQVAAINLQQSGTSTPAGPRNISVQTTQLSLTVDVDGHVDVSVDGHVDVSVDCFWPPQPSGSQVAEVTSSSVGYVSECPATSSSFQVPTYDVESVSYDLLPDNKIAQCSRQFDTPVPTYDVDLSSDPKPAGSSSIRSLVNADEMSSQLSPKSERPSSAGLALETIAGCSKTGGNDVTVPLGSMGSMSKDAETKEVPSSESTVSVAAAVPKIEESRGEDSHRSEVVSPEPNCAICLGKMQNKSFTNSCFHQFCFTCLLEWSKVKPECPLCKQPFKSIVHNVRSMEDYDQYHLRTEEFHSWDNTDVRRFRYRSTLTSERRREATLGRLLTTHHAGGSRSAASAAFVPVRHLYSTSDFRRYIYERGLWVQSSARTTRSMTRYREATPEFYSANPACTHRLLPWLNRELNALNYGHQTAFLLELITSLVLRFHIESPEFGEHLRPYFLNNTEHFIHEFHNFARSPFDMGDYDRHATYPDVTSPANSSGNDDGGDPDVVFLSQRRDPMIRQLPTYGHPAATRTNHATVLNRARDFLLTLQRQKGAASAARTAATSSSGTGEPSQSRSPQPGPSGVPCRSHDGQARGDRSSRPLIDINVFCSSSSDDDSADDEALLRSIINARTLARLRAQHQERKPLVTINVEDEEEDDCLIVDVVGKTPRSPVAVIMLSDSDDEVRVDHQNGSSSDAAATAGSSSGSSQVAPSTSSGVQSSPAQLPIKIRLSLTKAGLTKASLAASRGARRHRISTSSSSSGNSLNGDSNVVRHIRSPSPYSWAAATNGSSGSSRRHRSTSPDDSSARSTPVPDLSSSSDSVEQPAPRRTVRSKVVRLSSVVQSKPDLSSGGGGESSSSAYGRVTSRSSPSRSCEDGGSSSSHSSGDAPKIGHCKRRRQRLSSDDCEERGEEVATGEAANDSSVSKSASPRKKVKKHKHHKSSSSKRKHRNKGSKREDVAVCRT